MISFNRKEGNNSPATLRNDKLFYDSANENLWKLALEKNGLYIALGKFDVISNTDKTKALPNNGSFQNVNITDNDSQNRLAINRNSSISKQEVLPESVLMNINLVNLKYKNSTKNREFNNTFIYHSVINELTNISKVIQTRSFLRELPNHMQWLNKNVLVTSASSNIEVWIRDSSLTSEKLSDVLKNVKHSMAELGASLSKVAVNGRVVYFREK